MSKENIKDSIIVFALVIACCIVLVVEYFMFMQPSLRGVFLTPEVISQAAIAPTTEEILIGTYFDDFTPSMKYTTIIKIINGKYYKTDIFNDGSQGTKMWNMKIVNGEERFYEEGDDGYFGEYMIIEKDRSIVFYDKQGFIYRLHPK